MAYTPPRTTRGIPIPGYQNRAPQNPVNDPSPIHGSGVPVHDDHARPVVATVTRPTTPRSNPKGPFKTLIPPGTPGNRQTPQGVRMIQQWLNKHGASIVVDGIWGPRTEAAYNRFAKHNLQTPPADVKPPPPVNAGGGRAPAGGGGGGGNNNRRQQNIDPNQRQTKLPPLPGLDTVSIAGKSIPDLVASIMKGNPINAPAQINPQHVDPAAFGAMMAQLQYGPAIQQLQLQQQQTQGALAPTLANINASYGNAANQVAQGAAANQNVAQQMQGQQDATAQALAAAVGNDPAIAQQLGQSADVTKGLLAQQALAQSGLDQANQGDVRLQQANAANQAVGQTNSQLDNLRQQLLSTIQQRALAQGTNQVQGMQMNDQFRSNAIQDNAQQMNTALAQALAGPQVTASRLQNLTNSAGLLEQLNQDRFNAGVTNHNLTLADLSRVDAHQAQMFNQQMTRLQARLTQQNQANANKPLPFYKVAQDPQGATQLHNLVWSGGLVNQQGQMAVNPQQTYSAILSKLKSQFPNADLKRLQNYAMSETKGAVTAAQNQGQFTAWRIKNGRWVLGKVGGTATGTATG